MPTREEQKTIDTFRFIAKGIINGYRLRVNDFLCIQHDYVQYRFPKSKKKRIRLKWFKNRDNWRTETVDKVFCIGNEMLVSSKIFEKLKQEL